MGALLVQSQVRRLINKTQFAPHQHAVGVEIFPHLNLDHISRDLRLVELGRERGEAEEPPSTETLFDEVEDHIIDYVREKHAEALANFEDQRQTYHQRLAKLSFHTVVAEIDDVAKSAASALDAEAHKAGDLSRELRRSVEAAEQDWVRFRSTNGLERPARYPEGLGAFVLRIGILVAIVVVEAAINGNFFAIGNDLGLIGGWFEAGIVALVNVGLGMAAGRFPARWAACRRLRPLGVTLLALWALCSIVFNLGVGHYRQALEALSPQPEVAALVGLFHHPIDLSLRGWMLFFLGIAFSSIALLDVRSMDDPYPGYGPVDRRLEAAKQSYIDERSDLLSRVHRLYEAARDDLAGRVKQIGKRRDEADAIHAQLHSLTAWFDQHCQYLEGAANGLIQIYRDANRKARPPRTTPPSFKRKWKQDFTLPPPVIETTFTEKGMAEALKRGSKRGNEGEKRLDRAREAAIANFPPLEAPAQNG